MRGDEVCSSKDSGGKRREAANLDGGGFEGGTSGGEAGSTGGMRTRLLGAAERPENEVKRSRMVGDLTRPVGETGARSSESIARFDAPSSSSSTSSSLRLALQRSQMRMWPALSP
jgi:hypothetical protein